MLRKKMNTINTPRRTSNQVIGKQECQGEKYMNMQAKGLFGKKKKNYENGYFNHAPEQHNK